MFEFIPVTQTDEIKKLYNKEDGYAYVGIENNKMLGSCYFNIKKYTVEIIKIDFPQDMPVFAEGLIRSALNFAANRGAYMVKCCQENVKSVLETMNFENKNGCYIGDIPTLLGGTCSNCQKQ